MVSKYWTYRDLDIGVRPQLYNRVYTLTDADPFTKEFYSETLGSPLAVRAQQVFSGQYARAQDAWFANGTRVWRID